MVYTVTFNPSLDYIVSVEDFRLGMTNRTSTELLLPGGKGINVSTVLKVLDMESTALGFVAGFTGNQIVKEVETAGIHAEFISLDGGYSRINLKLRSVEGTEINGNGPMIKQEKLQELYRKLENLTVGDVLVLAGSIPSSLSDSIYRDIMEKLQEKDILIAVDATRDLLLNVLEFHPFLIKPNKHELEEIFNVKIHTRKEVIPYAKKLQERGGRNILVSLAGDGAVLLAENGEVYLADAPAGNVVNGVGAGDSMVAGFLAGWLGERNYRHAFCLGVASGSANAFSEGFATRNDIERLYKEISIYE